MVGRLGCAVSGGSVSRSVGEVGRLGCAVSVPGAKAQLTAFTATWPPKRIVRFRVSSKIWRSR